METFNIIKIVSGNGNDSEIVKSFLNETKANDFLKELTDKNDNSTISYRIEKSVIEDYSEEEDWDEDGDYYMPPINPWERENNMWETLVHYLPAKADITLAVISELGRFNFTSIIPTEELFLQEEVFIETAEKPDLFENRMRTGFAYFDSEKLGYRIYLDSGDIDFWHFDDETKKLTIRGRLIVPEEEFKDFQKVLSDK